MSVPAAEQLRTASGSESETESRDCGHLRGLGSDSGTLDLVWRIAWCLVPLGGDIQQSEFFRTLIGWWLDRLLGVGTAWYARPTAVVCEILNNSCSVDILASAQVTLTLCLGLGTITFSQQIYTFMLSSYKIMMIK